MKEEKNLFPPQIIIGKGMENCDNNGELYLGIIAVFIEEGRKRLPLIKQLYKEANWKDYIVAVHGLKSSANTIGALELAERAKEMEFAGKEKKIDLIHEKTDALLNEYLVLLQKLTAFCKSKSEAEQIEFLEKSYQ
ncbi:MAG: Hpt domain-containing protein [Lachnospiraceae bacterium]|nr:Hpt domain-containing protein [Lachnospiraceae bacterium]